MVWFAVLSGLLLSAILKRPLLVSKGLSGNAKCLAEETVTALTRRLAFKVLVFVALEY